MKAIVASRPGGPEVLEMVEVADPVPGPEDILVRVHATALNRADILQREGRYPPPPGAGDVLGLELAGAVAEVGESVTGWTVGDRVCAVVPSGGYAEFATVPETQALPVPGHLDFEQAAAIPEAFTTAWDNLFTRGGLAAEERVLIHGGSSGVGTAAIQLARRAGARIAATASTAEKLDACAQLGADLLVNYTTEDFADAVHGWSGGEGVDVILDLVGAAYLDRNLRALALEGRLVVIGLQGGASATLDIGRVLRRRLSVMGSTLRARDDTERSVVAQSVRAHVLPGFDDGSLHPVIDHTLDWHDVQRAHHAMEAGGHIGKIVLSVG